MPVYAALRYRDAGAAIEWLERAFGVETLARHDGPDGSVAHAELRLGGGIVMLGTGGDALQDPPSDLRDARVSVYVALEDVDAHRERAQAAGAEVSELIETDYGSRDYSVLDLEGNRWSFGTYVPQG